MHYDKVLDHLHCTCLIFLKHLKCLYLPSTCKCTSASARPRIFKPTHNCLAKYFFLWTEGPTWINLSAMLVDSLANILQTVQIQLTEQLNYLQSSYPVKTCTGKFHLFDIKNMKCRNDRPVVACFIFLCCIIMVKMNLFVLD